jgi:hypothetical protein
MEPALLTEIADACALNEGPEGVRRVLSALARLGATPAADLARNTLLPVPVIAAMRRELERRGLAQRGRGVELTAEGQRLVAEDLGLAPAIEVGACACGGTPVELPPVLRATLDRLTVYSTARPGVDTTLDQSFGTPESVLRRALYMWQHDAVRGREIAILGDDDLLSLAVCLLAGALCQAPPRLAVTVFEVDERIGGHIAGAAAREALPIRCIRHDLRGPLPDGHREGYDVFATDPPYTVPGARLFISRGLTALRPGPGRHAFVCFGHKPPREALAFQGELTGMGLQIAEVLPAFNRYEGSAVLGGTSQLFHLLTTDASRPAITGPEQGAIYTGDRGRPRTYRCAACGRAVRVGNGQRASTIEQLKAEGCPWCGGRKFRRIGGAPGESTR